MDNPTIPCRVELRSTYTSVEANVTTEVEFVIHIAKIVAEFRPRRIEFTKRPIPPQVAARILINRAGRIDAGPRITIPMPDTTKTTPSLKHLNSHARAAQSVQQIESRKSRTDNQDIEIFDFAGVCRFHVACAHICSPAINDFAAS